MDAEEAGVGAARDAGLRRRRHQGRARRRGRGGDRRDRQACARRQGRHTEDEPAQVRQGRGYGGAYLSQRGVGAAQSQGPILLRTDLRECAKLHYASLIARECEHSPGARAMCPTRSFTGCRSAKDRRIRESRLCILVYRFPNAI